MLRQMALVAVAGVALSGCGRVADSAFNPLNWFGSSGVAAVATGPLVPAGALVAPVDARVPVTVTRVEVARTDSGALVTATGIAQGAGYFNAQLVRVGIDGGVLVLRFVAEAPQAPVAGMADEIVAATAVSAATMAGLRGVRVEGAVGATNVAF
jgi:hypothetical protein